MLVLLLPLRSCPLKATVKLFPGPLVLNLAGIKLSSIIIVDCLLFALTIYRLVKKKKSYVVQKTKGKRKENEFQLLC